MSASDDRATAPSAGGGEPRDTAATAQDQATRITGEHVFGALVADPAAAGAATARRIADLSAQVGFLDSEVTRYRELLEAERIRHARQLADLTLDFDTRLDQARQDERREIEELHRSYRTLLAERQIEFDGQLSAAATQHAHEMAEERRRHDEILQHERERRRIQIEAARSQVTDELTERHDEARHRSGRELQHARAALARGQAELAEITDRLQAAQATVHEQARELRVLHRRFDALEEQRTAQIADLEAEVRVERDRAVAERARSAAALAELLERSAAIAAEADMIRADAAAKQVEFERAVAAALEQAGRDHDELIRAADARAQQAAQREAELEAALAGLRRQGRG